MFPAGQGAAMPCVVPAEATGRAPGRKSGPWVRAAPRFPPPSQIRDDPDRKAGFRDFRAGVAASSRRSPAKRSGAFGHAGAGGGDPGGAVSGSARVIGSRPRSSMPAVWRPAICPSRRFRCLADPCPAPALPTGKQDCGLRLPRSAEPGSRPSRFRGVAGLPAGAECAVRISCDRAVHSRLPGRKGMREGGSSVLGA